MSVQMPPSGPSASAKALQAQIIAAFGAQRSLDPYNETLPPSVKLKMKAVMNTQVAYPVKRNVCLFRLQKL